MDRRRFLELSVGALGAAGIVSCGRRGGDEALGPVLSEEVAFAFDNAGNRYEMDFNDYEVRRVAPDGAIVWSQGNVSNPALFNYPTSMEIDADGTIYVADRGNGEVERLSPAGLPLGTFATELESAEDISLDRASKELYVSGGIEHTVRVYSAAGLALRRIGEFGTAGAGLNGPRGVALSPSRELHVVDSGNARVQVYGLDGSYRRSYGDTGAEELRLRMPRDIVFDSAGRPLISDPVAMRLARYSSSGALVEHVELKDDQGRIGVPLYLAIAPTDRLYATVIFA